MCKTEGSAEFLAADKPRDEHYMTLLLFGQAYLFTGEISVHLLYGFDPLIGQDALKHRMKNHQEAIVRSKIKPFLI